MYKILLISSLTPTSTANYILRALRDDGCDVFVCSDVANPLVNCLANGAVDVFSLCQIHDFLPDLVLFIEGGSMRLFPVAMERLTCITAWYGIDTHMDYKKHIKIGRMFDVSFIAQKEYVQLLREEGLRQVFWLPLAFAPELLPDFIPKRTIDVAYVGSDNAAIHPSRHALLAKLRQSFPSHRFGLASPKEMGEIYSSAYVVFNKSVKNDMNMRFFEAMGAGAVLVTNPIINNGLDDLFIAGKHYQVYIEDSELVPMVTQLISNKKTCLNIGESARECILAFHTYSHRVATMRKIVATAQKVSVGGPAECFSTCLSLNLYTGALDAISEAFSTSINHGYRRYIGNVISAVIWLLARIVSFVEWLVSKISKFRKLLKV